MTPRGYIIQSMALADYITPHSVVMLTSPAKIDAFDALAARIAAELQSLSKATILDEVWKRELFLPTRVSTFIAMPHAVIRGLERSVIALGISKDGIQYEDSKDNLPIKIVVMLVGNDTEHLPVLTEIATKLSNKELCEALIASRSPEEAYRLLTSPFASGRPSGASRAHDAQITLRAAAGYAADVGASRIVLHADALSDPADLKSIGDMPTIIVSNDPSRFTAQAQHGRVVVSVPFSGGNRSTQVEVSLLFLLSQGLIEKGERVVSVFGMPGSETFDAIFFTDIDEEFKVYFRFDNEGRANELAPSVLTRVLQLANQLAVEGREGKPVGALFVVGDYDNVRRYSQQLIINPFRGYAEDQRNVLDPSLEDTVKEYSRIDGAFVIRGDGVIMSAGTYLKADSSTARLPPGLGARHAAAAAITSMTRSIAVTVSESTQKISLFRAGERFLQV
jgi:diadenylate cyclase